MHKDPAFWFRLSHEARAALMAVAANTLNGIVVFGVYHMSGEQLATADAWLSSIVVFIGYISATSSAALQPATPTDDVKSDGQT